MVPEKLKTEPPNLDWICKSDHVHGHGLIDHILIPFIKKLRHEIYHDSHISSVHGFGMKSLVGDFCFKLYDFSKRNFKIFSIIL